MIHLDFEENVAALESKISELRRMSAENDEDVDLDGEIQKLEKKRHQKLSELYKNLDASQRIQVARHPNRPHYRDYLKHLITDYIELAGDRSFGDDKAIYGGVGRFDGRSVMVIGQEKGHDTESRMKHNFGMACPEGYRKTIRQMRLAEQFGLPVLVFVDTSGAYPGVGAEQRGQAEAIARAIETCLDIRVPLVATIIGEGGSGGAIAIASANCVLMLENSVYSVISPEGCASILWKDASYAKDAAKALKITARDLKELGVIDAVVKEPVGGAHRDHEQTLAAVRQQIKLALDELSSVSGDELRARRRQKFIHMGSTL